MPQPYDYFGLMGGAANIGGVNANIQNTLLGQQSIQQNDNVLAQQARAEEARKAMSDIVLAGGSSISPVGIAATPEDEARSRYPGVAGRSDAPVDVNAAWARLARADPQAAAQLRAQMEQKQATSQLLADPNNKNIFEYSIKYPAMVEALEKAHSTLGAAQAQAALQTSSDVFHLLDGGHTKAAAQLLRNHMAAAKATGEDVSAYPQLIEMIETDPAAAKVIAGSNMIAAVGRDKFGETYAKVNESQRADELQPSTVLKGAADASKAQTEAQYAAPKIESDLASAAAQRQRMADQTANEQADLTIKRSGLDLERDKLSSTIQLELEKLDRTGTQLDAGGRAEVNKSVGESVGAQALAERMNNLADRIHGTSMSSGAYSAAREHLKGLFGGQDPVSGLRSEYNQLVNQQAVKNLPPGPASDKDIILAKQGFPPSSANAAYLESFLRGMAKMQSAVAASSERKANWISANGSLAPARRDTDVGGVQVPAGTTFNEFNGNAVKRDRQGAMPAGLTGILQKYGQ